MIGEEYQDISEETGSGAFLYVHPVGISPKNAMVTHGASLC